MSTSRRMFLGAVLAALAGCSAPPKATHTALEGPLVRGVSYVGLSVRDLDRSAAFYRISAGLLEVDRSTVSRNSALEALAGRRRVTAATRLLRGGNAQIRLIHFDDPSAAALAAKPVPVQGPGITHVCHQSPASKPLYPRFVAAGATPVTRGGEPIRLVPEVPIRYIYARDPDGIMFENEIYETDPPPAFDHRLSHVAIAVADIDKTVEFYTALLGRAPRERRSNLARPTLDQAADLDNVRLDVAWYTIGNLELEVWEYLNPPPSPQAQPRPLDATGYNMIVLDVADVDAAAAKLVQAGGKLETRPTAMDGGRIAFGRDVDGNLIGLFSAPPHSPFSSAHFESREKPPVVSN
jgi:catechol 2,3-dioxygenase-like lactoylglutathione lyase family enzyme